MDKNTTKSTFTEYLIPFDAKFVTNQIRALKLDRYLRKMDTETCSKLFIYAQLMQIKSYTDLSLEVKNNEQLQQEIDLKSISTSQLSRRFRDLNPALYESVFQHLVKKIHRQFGIKKGNQALSRIHLIDSSTISMCLTRYRWAEFRNTKAGIKLHTRISLWDEEHVVPDKVVLTPAKPADKTQMDELIVMNPDALNVFDRGYLDYRKYDSYDEKGIRFVTRLKDNAIIKVLEEKPVVADSPIVKEAIVLLGNPATYQMKHPVRLIETFDSKGNKITIITNDMKMSVEEVSDAYRYRWQIELFFKWIKQHLHIKRFYGESADAVYNQIRVALIAFCLKVLLKQSVAYYGSLLMIQKLLRLCCFESFSSFIRKLHRKPGRTSAGRRRWDHERIFNEILEQHERGEAEHLNDLTYDPIVL